MRTAKPNYAANSRDKASRIAVEMFVERGLANFTMREFAKRLGVSVMTPYRYLSGKKELLLFIKSSGFCQPADRLEATLVSPTALRCLSLVQAYSQFAQDGPGLYRVMFESHGLEISQQNSKSIRLACVTALPVMRTGSLPLEEIIN